MLKEMKKWDRSSRIEDIGKKQKKALKSQRVKSQDLYNKVFLNN